MIIPPISLPQAAIDLVEQSEGFRANAYPDPVSGGEPITIGWGRTGGVKLGDTTTPDIERAWLVARLQSICDAINRDCTWDGLTADEMAALIDFAYNLGVGALEGSTLWRLLMAGDVAGADAQFPRWDMAGGHAVAGLLRRREAEAALFMEGDPNAGPTAS